MINLTDYIRSVYDFPVQGVHFRDITPLLENPLAFSEAVKQLANTVREWGPFDGIAAPEARGFVFAAPLAIELGIGLITIRKPGKLPYKTVSISYELEYGSNTIQMHEDAVKPGDRILLADDLLATGGTMEACRKLLEKQGATVVGAVFVIELLDLKGRKNVNLDKIETLIKYT